MVAVVTSMNERPTARVGVKDLLLNTAGFRKPRAA